MLISSVWRERSRWWFSGGLLIGGLTSALVIVALGALLLRPFVPAVVKGGIVAVVFLLIVIHELGWLRLPLPQNARQVPETITEDGAAYGALQFGFEMGTGIRTYMTTGLPHALAAGLLLLAGWPEGLLAGLAFGAGRALMTLSRDFHTDHESWDRALRRHDKTVRIILTGAFAAVLAHIAYQVLLA